MEVLDGKEYLLSITQDISNDKIDYLGKTISPRFTKWGEISGKRVKIKAKLRTLVDYYEVCLVNDVNHVFYVSKRMLSLIPHLMIRCRCTNRQLFSGGCHCGAFLKEVNSSHEN
jgi:hypothetical protein